MGRRLVSSIRGGNILGTMTVDSSTITSLLTNSNITFAPDGTGDVYLNADLVRVGDSNATATVTTNGTGDLVINTNSGTNSGSLTIANGTNGNITIATNGTGDVYLDADTIRVGDSNASVTITSNGTGDMVINTNSGTNSGSITIANGTNGNITIATNGSGDVYLDADTIRVGDSNATATITTNGTGTMIINTNSGTNSGALTITQGTNGNISLLGNGTSSISIGISTNSVSFGGTTDSTSSSTGSVVFEGGVGIKKALNVATTLTVAGGAVAGVLTTAFNDSSTTFDGNSYVTGYVANGVTYSLMTYQLVSGAGSILGGQYRRLVSWRETDNATGTIKNYTATYSSNGRVSTITVA